MKNISKLILIALLAFGLTSALGALASWSTRAKLRCDRGVVANMHITLTLDGQTIQETDLSCANGGSDSVEIVTHQKPNDWHVSGTVNGTPCSGSGTSFPARLRCTASPLGATVQLWHPREVPDPEF